MTPPSSGQKSGKSEPNKVPNCVHVELRDAVSRSYQLSCQQKISLYDAWLAARTIALKIHPEMENVEAGLRVMTIIAWQTLQTELHRRCHTAHQQHRAA
jgi:hypothetical protein